MEQLLAQDERRATARTNTEVLRFAQKDNVGQTMETLVVIMSRTSEAPH